MSTRARIAELEVDGIKVREFIDPETIDAIAVLADEIAEEARQQGYDKGSGYADDADYPVGGYPQ